MIIELIIETVTDALGTMAMVNYPYETSFIFPMPAWPVNASCEAALSQTISSDVDYVRALNKAV